VQNTWGFIVDEIVVCQALELLGVGINAFVLSPFSPHLGHGLMSFVCSRVFVISLIRLVCSFLG